TRWEWRDGGKFKVDTPESEWSHVPAPELRIIDEALEASAGPHRAHPRDVPWATDGRSASGSPRGWAHQQSPAGWLPALWHRGGKPDRHGSERSRRGQEVLDLHDGGREACARQPPAGGGGLRPERVAGRDPRAPGTLGTSLSREARLG